MATLNLIIQENEPIMKTYKYYIFLFEPIIN